METPPDSPDTDDYPDFPTPPHVDANGWFHYNDDDGIDLTNERSWTHTSLWTDHNFGQTSRTVRSNAYTTLEEIRQEFPEEYDFRYANESNGILTIIYIGWVNMEEFTDIITIYGLSPDEIYLLSEEIAISKEKLA